MEKRFQQALQKIEEKGLTRNLQTLSTGNEPEIIIDGKKLLLFSSNNYLGLATDSRLKHEAIKTMKEFGTGTGGARLTTGNFSIHQQLEQEIATWKNDDTALVFSSGYLANIGVISSIMQKGDVIFSDELNHASIIDGCRLSPAEVIIYKHTNMRNLEMQLKEWTGNGKKLIVTDGVFSMDGTIAPLPEIVALAEKYKAYILVDDAHGTGVLGENGAGTASYFNIQHKINFTVGTLSKAVGAEGGYVTASSSAIRYLQNRARSFIYQTSLSPATLGAAREGVHLIQKEPERRNHLLQHAKQLYTELTEQGFIVTNSGTPILSVIIGGANNAVYFSNRLREKGIFIPAIRPPTVPENTSRLRVTVMATHTTNQLNRLVTSMVKVGKELNIIPR